MKQREKCAGWTKGDFRGNYPCGLYAIEGSRYCRYHDPKMLDAKEEARLAKAKDTPPIGTQESELHSAGWTHKSGTLWKDPQGSYFRGPHGAWLAMKRREEQSA